jgi:hypothetical protein
VLSPSFGALQVTRPTASSFGTVHESRKSSAVIVIVSLPALRLDNVIRTPWSVAIHLDRHSVSNLNRSQVSIPSLDPGLLQATFIHNLQKIVESQLIPLIRSMKSLSLARIGSIVVYPRASTMLIRQSRSKFTSGAGRLLFVLFTLYTFCSMPILRVHLVEALGGDASIRNDMYGDSCNESICGSIVSKCLLTQSCKCDLKSNVTCSKDCFYCLDFLYHECCACVGKPIRVAQSVPDLLPPFLFINWELFRICKKCVRSRVKAISLRASRHTWKNCRNRLPNCFRCSPKNKIDCNGGCR